MLQRFALAVSTAALAVTVACSQSDPGITSAVKSKFAADDTVKAYQIDVDTSNRVVTLTGNVDSAAAKEQAVQIARQTNGVTNVVDRITVRSEAAPTSGDLGDRSRDIGHDVATEARDVAHDAKTTTEHAASNAGEAISDAAITSEVKAKFLAEPGVSGLKIDVDTSNGIVTLSGNVKTAAEAEKATSIARRSAGVKDVVNRLHVG